MQNLGNKGRILPDLNSGASLVVLEKNFNGVVVFWQETREGNRGEQCFKKKISMVICTVGEREETRKKHLHIDFHKLRSVLGFE